MAVPQSTQLDLFDQDVARPIRRRKYRLDDNYFRNITMPAQARWLGLIASDGCVFRDTIAVKLEAKDREHLEMMRQAIGYDGPVSEGIEESDGSGRKKPTAWARLRFSSPQMCADLLRNGVPPRKSRILRPWKGPPELMRFWWGGMVDGDGTFREDKNRRFAVSLSTGSLAIARAWVAFVFAETGCPRPINEQASIWQPSYSGTRVPRRLAQLLYDDLQGSVPLARKRAVAAQAIALPDHGPYKARLNWKTANEEEVRSLLDRLDESHQELGNWAAVAEALDTTETAIKAMTQRAAKFLGIPRDEHFHRYDHITREQIEASFAQTRNWRETAKHLGMTPTALLAMRRRLGFETGTHKTYPHLTKEHLLALFAELGEWRLVADRIGVPFGSMSPLKQRLGIDMRKNRDWSGVSLDDLKRLHEQLGDWHAVGRHFGVPTSVITNIYNYRRKVAEEAH